jgi:hypothetical protein
LGIKNGIIETAIQAPAALIPKHGIQPHPKLLTQPKKTKGPFIVKNSINSGGQDPREIF